MREYLTLADVISMHKVLIARYGGAEGIRDIGVLDSAIHRPQTGYYSGIIEEASALFESLAMNHPFIDGNKRIAFAATDVFLKINGYRINRNSDDIYEFMLSHLEKHSFNFENIRKWLNSVVTRQ